MEGPLAVGAAIASSAVVVDLLVDESRTDLGHLVALAESAGIPVTAVAPAAMAAMSETEHPQGALAVCATPGRVDGDLESILARVGTVVVLDEVGDPGNVGTAIRTGDAAGAAGVVLTPGCADPFGGKVVRSTAGSLFHLPVLADRPISEIADAAVASGRQIAVTAADGATDLFDAVRTGQVGRETVWVVGSEARGASLAARDRADLTVSIPMAGRAESLNAGVAVAVVLYVTSYGVARADFGPGKDE